jgi:hypothetical protein
MSSLLSNRATTRLMNSLLLSEWKPRMRKGNCRIRAHNTGSSQASLMHGGVVFVDEKTISTADIGGLVWTLTRLARETGDWDWTNRIYFLRR